MERLKNYITSLHQSTKREYLKRMNDDKISCMLEAKKYEFNYWDGDRRYGYGGYKYIPGRWTSFAEQLISDYNLKDGSRILDAGCGKGFLLLEIKKILPKINIVGIDISNHALKEAPEILRQDFFIHNLKDPLPFKDNEFDLVISINALHNLHISELKIALTEIERVGKKKYIAVESYRNEKEQFNLQCWALTCESFFNKDSWIWLYDHFGYKGDYEFIYFE
tara:strand:+ start:1835 stop:2500 length:666 start_codon:yes stop_codon:yes gene_type:complete